MHLFQDATGREWRVQLDIAAAFRVDEAAIQCRGKTLVLSDPERWFFTALMRSVALQVKLLWHICRPQAEEEGISQEEFHSLLSATVPDGADGQTTVLARDAITALGLEIADFFQSCPTSFNRLIQAQRQLAKLLMMGHALTSDANETTQPAGTAPPVADPATASTGCAPPPELTGGRPD